MFTEKEVGMRILFFFYEAMVDFIFIFNYSHTDPIKRFYALLVAI